MLVWSETEVLDGLTGVFGTSEKEGVAASWGTESQLIESQGLSSGSKDACASSCGESESSNAELRNGQETIVVCDSTDNDDGSLLALLGSVCNNSGDGHRGSVDAGHKKSAENDLVEGGLGAACHQSLSIFYFDILYYRSNLRAKKRYSFTSNRR